MIDTNVCLFRWPYRRLEADDPDVLLARLRARGVTQAWAGSFEALWHRDMAGVNSRLADACRQAGQGFFLPFGCVNPRLPDWKEDLRRCREVHQMPGIRLFPNYHGYTLADPSFVELVSQAAAFDLIVQIAISMEDTRTQLTITEPVDPAPLAGLLPRIPQMRMVLLNSGSWNDDEASEGIGKIRNADNAYFDIAMNEGVGGLARLIASTSPKRVVFGSHSPFFYFESAWLKVRSAELLPDVEQDVYHGNAQSLLGRRI